MKILFSVGELEKGVNATTKIVLQLAERLCLLGHSCMVAGVCNAFPSDEVKNGVEIKRLPAVKAVVKASEAFEKFIAEGNGSRNGSRMDFVKKHPVHALAMFVRYRPEYYKKIEQPRYLKQIKQLTEEFRPDAVVCVCKPVLPVETVALSDMECPVYFYQVDPWGLHRIDNADNRSDIIEKELAVFRKSKAVFTTPILKQQYLEHPLYKKCADKLVAVEFPNIKEYTPRENVKSAVEFDADYTNILFCGIVTDEFRSPEYTLKALSDAFDRKEKTRVYFLGVNNSRVLDEYIKKYPENVFFHDRVDGDTAFATMEKADILFNISNMLDNQVPSKIFDYFSMGKPVLNLQKIENCPAQEYFEKYPLCFNMKEFEEADKDSLYTFIKEAKGRKLDFCQVEKIYASATVEYVADIMEENFRKNI